MMNKNIDKSLKGIILKHEEEDFGFSVEPNSQKIIIDEQYWGVNNETEKCSREVYHGDYPCDPTGVVEIFTDSCSIVISRKSNLFQE
jgi:hypothetical protein